MFPTLYSNHAGTPTVFYFTDRYGTLPSFDPWGRQYRRDERARWKDRIKEFYASTALLARAPLPADGPPGSLAPRRRPRARKPATRLPRDAKGPVGWRRTRRAA